MGNSVQFHIILRFRLWQISYDKITLFVFDELSLLSELFRNDEKKKRKYNKTCKSQQVIKEVY